MSLVFPRNSPKKTARRKPHWQHGRSCILLCRPLPRAASRRFESSRTKLAGGHASQGSLRAIEERMF